MKTLQLTLLIILLTGGAAAQVPANKSGAPDVAVIGISWRRVAPGNPNLTAAGVGGSPDYAARMAVNTARINENISARQSGGNPPPPQLLYLPSIPDSPPIVRPWSGWVYEFTIKNTGAKIIRQMTFDYTFTDPGTQQTVRRRQYKSNVRIAPGITAKIVVHSSLPPMGTIKATQTGQNPADQSAERMVINRIKYADGSIWQRSAAVTP
jgi:hypothetical protein